MLISRQFAFAALLLAVSAAGGSVAFGQLQVHAVDAQGKIVEIGPGVITVKTLANSVLYGSLDPVRKEGNIIINGLPPLVVEVNGELNVSDLGKGQIVRFTVELDNRKVVGEVSQVAVLGMVEPPNVSLGMVPEAGEDLGKKKPTTGKFIVVGRVESARGGYLEVDYGGGKQKAKLSAEATVSLTASDLSFARSGDDVKIEGAYIALPRVHLSKVTVTKVKAADVPKKQPRPAPMGKTPKKGKEDDGPGEFGLSDPHKAGPMPPPGEVARPKEKGKVVKVN